MFEFNKYNNNTKIKSINGDLNFVSHEDYIQ
jgi:hypothetical protein